MKRIAILGSTGSIGTQTLEVVENNQDIQVTALAAGSNIRLLEEQIRKFHPTLACVWDEKKAAELRTNIADLSVKVVSGMDGLLEVAVQPEAEILVTAIVGMIGIRPTIAAMKAGKDIALANKETLVTAGHIIMPLAKEVGVKILPVDSEHSAIFQAIHGEENKEIHHCDGNDLNGNRFYYDEQRTDRPCSSCDRVDFSFLIFWIESRNCQRRESKGNNI